MSPATKERENPCDDANIVIGSAPLKSLEQKAGERPTDQAIALLAVEITNLGKFMESWARNITKVENNLDKVSASLIKQLNNITDRLKKLEG